MVHRLSDLSPELRAAAELLMGRPLHDNESIPVQAFEPAPISEQQRRGVSEELRGLFAEVDLHLRPGAEEEAEDVFTEAGARADLNAAYRRFMSEADPERKNEAGKDLIRAVFWTDAIAEDLLL